MNKSKIQKFAVDGMKSVCMHVLRDCSPRRQKSIRVQ